MTNAEATIAENAATVAEQGAHVAPDKTSPKKGANPKKGADRVGVARHNYARGSPTASFFCSRSVATL
jgi:hypothetical protein